MRLWLVVAAVLVIIQCQEGEMTVLLSFAFCSRISGHLNQTRFTLEEIFPDS